MALKEIVMDFEARKAAVEKLPRHSGERLAANLRLSFDCSDEVDHETTYAIFHCLKRLLDNGGQIHIVLEGHTHIIRQEP